MKNLLLGLLLVLGLGFGFYFYYYWQNHQSFSEKTVFEPKDIMSEDNDIEEKSNDDNDDFENTDVLDNASPNEEIDLLVPPVLSLPAEFKLKVAFSTQAPTENWGMPYQEACEEASLIMAYYYFANKPLSRPIMNEEILKLVDWENQTFGYYEHTTLAETARMAEEYFNLDVEISEDVTVDNLKNQIYAGNLVILPFAGRLLENSHFSGQGPLYHMAVLKGWDKTHFIMNDPGLLRLGENFRYSYNNLMESIHDWDDDNILNGRKAMLIVKGLKK